MKRIIEWTPGKVTVASVLVMGLIVIGVGLSSMRYVIDYLYKGMVEHGLTHNHEVAERLEPLLAPRLALDDDPNAHLFRRVVQLYGAFGYRIFVVENGTRLIADSHSKQALPRPLRDSWLAELLRGDEDRPLLRLEPGSFEVRTPQGGTLLVSLHPMQVERYPNRRFLLGVVSDLDPLIGFVDDLHRNLDWILLATFLVIGLIGVLGMRAVGRIYERRLEETLAERTRELEAAHQRMVEQTRLATIGKTAAVLAHEMRNPLSSIKLALSGLTPEDGLSERAERRIRLVVGEVDRLEALLNQTLDYARPLQVSKKPVDIDELVARVVEAQQPLLERRGLVVDHRRCKGCPGVCLDEAKFHQVLLNVLKNAIEASPDGGVITIATGPGADGRLRIEVGNAGRVPDEEVLEKAFEPFFTTKPRGAGLGLGLVKRIVEEHGGSVALEREATDRVRLVIELPLRPGAAVKDREKS